MAIALYRVSQSETNRGSELGHTPATSTVHVTVEIQVEVPEGIPENFVRIVTENANTLRLRSGFEGG